METKTVAIYLLLFATILIVLCGFKKPSQEKWKSPESASKIINPIKNDSKTAASGKKLYQALCAVCHGPKGKGDGMAGAGLTPKPANLSGKEVQAQTDGAIFWKIAEGRTPMPSYRTAIPEKNRWEIINYIRTLKK